MSGVTIFFTVEILSVMGAMLLGFDDRVALHLIMFTLGF
jgi:hypothetical protein